MAAHSRRGALAAIVLATATVLGGCAGAGGAAIDTLQGSWVLQSGADAQGAFIDSVSPVTLEVDGRDYSGDSPCNLYSGTLATDGGGVDFGEGGIMSTERACLDAEQMDLEARYYGALLAVERAESTGDELVLTGPGVELVYAAAAD